MSLRHPISLHKNYAMKTVNGATPSSTPLSVLSDRRTEPRKAPLVSIASPLKLPGFYQDPTSFARVFVKKFAWGSTATVIGSTSSFEIDPNGILDSVVGFATENPTVVAGALALLFDGNSELAAELVTTNGFKAAYAVKDGADEPRGWVNSDLPWITLNKGLDLGILTETFTEAFGEEPDGLSVTVGIAAGLGFLAFSELETILQLLGSAAIVQFVSKKLLFVEEIGVALLLPTSTSSNALPSPTEAKPEPKVEAVVESPQINSVLQTKSEADGISGFSSLLSPYASPATSKATLSPTEAKPEPKVEEAAAKTPLNNSVPKTESTADGNFGFPRQRSPYASYPDLKPPTSPTPSQP
ncbi:hypothetical protein GQ457_11G001610 [Hibiscus cannabinus]